MAPIKLSVLSVLLGLALAIPSIFGLAKPNAYAAGVRNFPRSLWWGYCLMAIGTAWFLYNLSLESVSDFASYKPMMYGGFCLLGILSAVYLKDFLAVRGLAIVIMLLAKVMLDTARWADTSWRLVIITWAYALIVAGIWFTVSPWRCRDFLQWGIANERRIRLVGGVRVAFAVLVVVLGVTVF
jgi:hypothetical protein